MSKEVMQQALEALEHCQDVIIERGLGGNAEFAEMWGLQLPLDRAGHAIEALRAAIEEKPSKAMTASRAEMFMRRFKHEEKLLGPNEQAALDFVIDILVSLQEGWELTVAEKPAQATIKAEDVIVETYTVTRGGFALHPQTGVRLTHKPTGTVVQCDAERSLHRNRETAWKDLEKILFETTPVPEPAHVTYKEVAEVMNSLWAGTTRDVQIAQVLATKKLYIDPPTQPAPVPEGSVSKGEYNRLRDNYNDLVNRSEQDAKDAKQWRAHVKHCQLQGVDLDYQMTTQPAAPVQEPVAQLGDGILWCDTCRSVQEATHHTDSNDRDVWCRGEAKWLQGPFYTTPPAAQPADSVPMPTTVEQAKAMALLGTAWLEQNAPHELKVSAPVQEPDAYLHDDGYWTVAKTYAGRQLNNQLLFAGSAKIGVYTTPPAAQRQWVGLTEDEQDELVYGVYDLRTRMELAIGIEAKLKEKNS